jgi:hypothetical protein
VILALFIALTALMALVCFGLSVLVIDSKSPLNRVVMIDGVSQTTKQKAVEIS